MKYISTLKVWIRDNERLINFVRKNIKSIAEFKKTPSPIDFLNLACEVKDNYDAINFKQQPHEVFRIKCWKKLFLLGRFNETILDCLLSSPNLHMKEIPLAPPYVGFEIQIDNLAFGVSKYENACDEIFVKFNKENEKEITKRANSLIKNLFWKKYNSSVVVLEPKTATAYGDDLTSRTPSFSIEPSDFIRTEQADSYIKTILNYLEKGYHRSLLFVGPPGSGKSNLVRNIINQLNLKAIRINGFSKLDTNDIFKFLQIVEPDAIILEDIDNVFISDQTDFLDKLDHFHQNQKLILATANDITHLNSAAIRPNRFDELIKIDSLEESAVLALVENDLEIFHIVKFWPAAFIIELMTRIKIKGREQGLATIKDLQERLVK